MLQKNISIIILLNNLISALVQTSFLQQLQLSILVSILTLSWKHHVSAIIDRSSRKIGVLWRYRNNMTEKERFLFHKAVIQPNIDYAAVAWSPLNKAQNQRLHRLEKKTVRVITNSPFMEFSKPLFQHLRFADFECRHRIQLAKLKLLVVI